MVPRSRADRQAWKLTRPFSPLPSTTTRMRTTTRAPAPSTRPARRSHAQPTRPPPQQHGCTNHPLVSQLYAVKHHNSHATTASGRRRRLDFPKLGVAAIKCGIKSTRVRRVASSRSSLSFSTSSHARRISATLSRKSRFGLSTSQTTFGSGLLSICGCLA
jgi:hypothetical protein